MSVGLFVEMIVTNDEFSIRLKSVPRPEDTVRQLFDQALKKSEPRVFLSIVGVERQFHEGKAYRQIEYQRHWVVQQFADYFTRVRLMRLKKDSFDPSTENTVRRLEMLAYCQFWECHAIQRLLTQLVKIVQGSPYDPLLLIENRPSTYDVFKNIGFQSNELGLSLDPFLKGVYSNQIRNAFAHSEFYVAGDYIIFLNADQSKDHHVGSLKMDTWDELFDVTSRFIISLFENNRDCERRLKALSPYAISLDEFPSTFQLSKDDRGYWTTTPTSAFLFGPPPHRKSRDR